MKGAKAILLVAAFGVLGCKAEPQQATAPAAVASARAQSGLEVVPLRIQSASGIHDFKAEVARTEEQQGRGLMFRERLGPDEAMLFPFEIPRPASFWMKDTLIPLDMIFIRADGSIARIAANTVPQSLETVGVGEPVAAVLEIAGGRSAELGIVEGDRVSWPGGPTL